MESAWTSHSDSQGQVRAFLSFQRKSHLFQTEQRRRFDWPGPISHFDFFHLGLFGSFFENQIPVIQVPALHDWERDTIPAQVESNFTLLCLIENMCISGAKEKGHRELVHAEETL